MTSEGYVPAGEWADVDAAIVRLGRSRAQHEYEEGRWLLAARRLAVHSRLGFATFSEYVERRLGHDPRTTADKLRVAAALVDLPLLQDALRTGALPWTAIREIVRVAVPDTEAEWLSAVTGHTVRDIERMVSGLHPGDDPRAPKDPALRKHLVRLELSPEQYARYRDAVDRVRKEVDSSLSDEEAVTALADRALGGNADDDRPPYQISITTCDHCARTWQRSRGDLLEVDPTVAERALCDAHLIGRTNAPDAPPPHVGTPPSPTPHVGAPPSPSAHVGAPTSVALIAETPTPPTPHVGASPSPTTHVGAPPSLATRVGAQPSVALDAEAPTPFTTHVGVPASLATHVGARPSPTTHVGAPPSPTTHVGTSPSLATHVGAPPSATPHVGAAGGRAVRTVSPRLRRGLMLRAKGRCEVPGCRNTRHLHVHHVIPQMLGGPNDEELCVIVCTTHHDLVHDGRLIIEGRVSAGMRFLHADGTAYGAVAPAPVAAAAARAVDDAQAALRGLGVEAPVARTLLTAALSALGAAASAEALVREALRFRGRGLATRYTFPAGGAPPPAAAHDRALIRPYRSSPTWVPHAA